MHKTIKFPLIFFIIWLIGLYGYAISVVSSPAGESNSSILALSTNNTYWSPNPSFITSEGAWDSKVWKWREFFGCGSIQMADQNGYTYVEWSENSNVSMSMLTQPDLDWVYVAGVSVGNVWDDIKPSYQPIPLRVSAVDLLSLEIKIDEWRGAPLSPIIFPSWYALLSDVWFNVTDVTIKDENGIHRFPSKVLGIDVFYHTMTGSLNAVMGGSNEFARIEPCNKNFIYSVNLADQDFYTNNDGLFTIDLLALLYRAQEKAAEHGWHFDIENVELVMFENVIESYWSYAYAKISRSGISYCSYEKEC